MELIAVLIAVATLFLWNIAESRSLGKHFETQMNALRADVKADSAEIRADVKADSAEIRSDIKNLISAIHLETKDFHSRLSVMEERHKGKPHIIK